MTPQDLLHRALEVEEILGGVQQQAGAGSEDERIHGQQGSHEVPLLLSNLLPPLGVSPLALLDAHHLQKPPGSER